MNFEKFTLKRERIKERANYLVEFGKLLLEREKVYR